jgi:DNA-binding NarL/FixJ family response regulator
MLVVAEACNGSEALTLWQQMQPDITLLDLRMPIMDGVDTIEAIHRIDSQARIIVLTTFDTDNDIFLAIKAGARGYLMKDIKRADLIVCIRCVHSGDTCIPPHLAAKLASNIGKPALTEREQQVLTMLASGKNNKDIGSRLYISETTVKSHLRNIFSKLNVISRTEAITAATRRGLVQL